VKHNFGFTGIQRSFGDRIAIVEQTTTGWTCSVVFWGKQEIVKDGFTSEKEAFDWAEEVKEPIEGVDDEQTN
jgi:hypothetical protein